MDSDCSPTYRADDDVSTYVKKLEDEEDTHILMCGGNTVNIHRGIFKDNLRYLRPAIGLDIDELTDRQKGCLENIIEALVASSDCKEMENELFRDIENILGVSEESISPGTIGAYFFGCGLAKKMADRSSEYMLTECNPLCVSSIGADLYGMCKDLVLIQTEDGLKAINQKKSSHCYVYRKGGLSNFVLDYHDYKSLKALGVKYVTVVSEQYKTTRKIPLKSIRRRWIDTSVKSTIYFFALNIICLLAILIMILIFLL